MCIRDSCGTGRRATDDSTFFVALFDGFKCRRSKQGIGQAGLITAQKPIAGKSLKQVFHCVGLCFNVVEINDVDFSIEHLEIVHDFHRFLIEFGARHWEYSNSCLAWAAG